MAASSSSAQDPPPTAFARPTPRPSRRVPPPCWTHEETVALIDSYREKWYSLRRGNLKAPHWQDVADSVALRCHLVNPSKTSVQCRHKVEKLRKRYRTEQQRALAAPNRFASSWVYFRQMDSMEKGSSSTAHSDTTDNDDDEDEEEEDDDENEDNTAPNPTTNTRSLHRLMTHGGGGSGGGGGGGLGGFRVRIPGRPSSLPSVTGLRSKSHARVDENPNSNPNYKARLLNGGSPSRLGFGRRGDFVGGGSKKEMDPIAEMVSSIKLLGEGFVRMEQMKIEMAREIEKMRMEMEMKRTEMILDSQQRIVDAFAKGFSGKKKVKRMPSPDS